HRARTGDRSANMRDKAGDHGTDVHVRNPCCQHPHYYSLRDHPDLGRPVPPPAISRPWATNTRYFAAACSGSFCTAERQTAPETAAAVSVSPGGTTGAAAGARLPPLQNAPRATQAAGLSLPAAVAAAIAARRFSSFGR